MKLSIKAGSTSQSVTVFIQDSASTTGAGKTGLTFSGITAYYTFAGANTTATSITMQTLALVTTAYATGGGGFIEIDAVHMPGLYRFDIPDTALASGKGRSVVIYLTATGAAPCVLEIELTGWDNQDGVRAGLTALPNAAAGANGGLPTGDASGHVTFANTSIATVTNLTNLPSIPANWLTAAGIAASALNGKGDWLLASSYTAPPSSATIAGAVWDVTLSSHLTAGTTGNALNAAGSAGDPWATAIPGAYGAGTAGNIVGNRLDAAISTRLATSGYAAPDNTSITAIKAKTDNLPASPAAVGSAMTLTTGERTSVADAILDRDMSAGTDSGSPTVRTVRQALRFLRNKWAIATGTLTVYKEDDTTSSWTATVATDGTAQPIVSNDPA